MKIKSIVFYKSIFPYLKFKDLIDLKLVDKKMYERVEFYIYKYVRSFSKVYITGLPLFTRLLIKFKSKSNEKGIMVYNDILPE